MRKVLVDPYNRSMRSSLGYALLLVLVVVPLEAATFTINIQDNQFINGSITIQVGDTVTWVWVNGFHSTTSDTGVWDSGPSSPPRSFSFTFMNTGSFPYHCSVHPHMTGTITVAAGAKTNTQTALSSSANPSVSGQNATLTATVSGGGAGGTPTGTVTFMDGGSALCTAVPLSGSTATCSTAPLTVGSHSITATYNGDSNFNTSTSDALTQVVNKAATTTVLESSSNPSTSGQQVTFTATVSATSPGSGTPGGTVTFNDGSTPICSNVALSGGSAPCATSSLTTGSHSITAVYSGNTSFNASTSATLTQTVQVQGPPPAPTMVVATATSTTAVQVSWNPSSGASSYEVFRSTSVSQPFSPVPPVTSETLWTDSNRAPNTTYLYRVQAIASGGARSAFSATDAATTVIFTDPSLAMIPVKALHITELRTAVNAMRAAADLGAGTYTIPLAAGTTILASHIAELRTALNEARSLIGLPAITYTDSPLNAGTTIKAAHVDDLRNGTR